MAPNLLKFKLSLPTGHALDAAGLKLESRKISKETIVVNHLEKMPTEN